MGRWRALNREHWARVARRWVCVCTGKRINWVFDGVTNWVTCHWHMTYGASQYFKFVYFLKIPQIVILSCSLRFMYMLTVSFFHHSFLFLSPSSWVVFLSLSTFCRPFFCTGLWWPTLLSFSSEEIFPLSLFLEDSYWARYSRLAVLLMLFGDILKRCFGFWCY